MVGIANGLTIIFLGLYDTDADRVSMLLHERRHMYWFRSVVRD